MTWMTLLCFFAFSVSATTFKPQSVNEQLSHADGVLIGHFLKSKSIQLENGKIATQMIFKINKEHGLDSDKFGMDEVIVHYPGGTVDGTTVQIQGTPKFVPGEKVVVFTKNVKNRFWGLNLGMGTYKVINYGKDVMMVNTLFPSHPTVGQMILEDFEKSVRLIKGSQLKVVQNAVEPAELAQLKTTRTPASLESGKNRTIASTPEETDNNGAGSSVKTFWLVAILAFLGACYRYANRISLK